MNDPRIAIQVIGALTGSNYPIEVDGVGRVMVGKTGKDSKHRKVAWDSEQRGYLNYQGLRWRRCPELDGQSGPVTTTEAPPPEMFFPARVVDDLHGSNPRVVRVKRTGYIANAPREYEDEDGNRYKQSAKGLIPVA